MPVSSSLADGLREETFTRNVASKGPLAFLLVGTQDVASASMREAFEQVAASEELGKGLNFFHFCADAPNKDRVPQIEQIAPQIADTVFGGDTDQVVLVIIKDAKKYVKEAGTKAVSDGEMQQFFRDFQEGKLEEFIKTEDRGKYPSDMEPLIPSVYRATARSFQQVVLDDPAMNVFVQEFADWCPYCVLMHPFTNDLAWVVGPIPNVRLAKIDCAANDTSEFEDHLQTRGIPNIVFMPARSKARPPARVKRFGEQGEGREPDMKVEDMVAFIYRHMDGDKFDENEFKQRAKLIQGQDGFLSEDHPSGQPWIEVLLGPKSAGRLPVRKGTRAKDPKAGNRLTKVWKNALDKACVWDSKNEDSKVEATELVMVKLMHQLAKEVSGKDITLDEARELEEEAKKLLTKFKARMGNTDCFASDSGPRCVSYEVFALRILSIDTANFCADVAFTAKFDWGLRKGDVQELAQAKEGDDENSIAWQPPELVIQNARVYPDEPRITQDVRFYSQPTAEGINQWRAQMLVQVQCTIVEGFELQCFPFDVQPLSIIMNFKQSEDEWRLLNPPSAKKQVVTYSRFMELAEWELHPALCEVFSQSYGRCVNVLNMTESNENDDADVNRMDVRPGLIVRAMAVRNWRQFFWSVIYIVVILALSSNLAFFLDPIEDYGDRLAVYLTNFLASVAFQSVIDDTLPKLKYVSFAQTYLILMNLLLFWGMICCAIQKMGNMKDTIPDPLGGDDLPNLQVGGLTPSMAFFTLNLVLWALINLTFFMYILCYRRPMEKRKLFELTPRLHLQPDLGITGADPDAVDRGVLYHRKNLLDIPELQRGQRAEVRVHTNIDRHHVDREAMAAALARSEGRSEARNHHLIMDEKFDPREAWWRAKGKVDAMGRFRRGSVDRDAKVAQNQVKPADAARSGGSDDVEMKCPSKQQEEGAFLLQSSKPLFGDDGRAWWSNGKKGTVTMPDDRAKAIWMKIFSLADRNGDGTIDGKEAARVEAMTSLPIVHTLQSADSMGNRDGKVSRQEWSRIFDDYTRTQGSATPGTTDAMAQLAKKLASGGGNGGKSGGGSSGGGGDETKRQEQQQEQQQQEVQNPAASQHRRISAQPRGVVRPDDIEEFSEPAEGKHEDQDL